MIADCETGKIDYIITKSISRFAQYDGLSAYAQAKEMGIYATSTKTISIRAASRRAALHITPSRRKKAIASLKHEVGYAETLSSR